MAENSQQSKPETERPASDQEAVLAEYYASGEVGTTQNYPLNDFIGSVSIQMSPTAGRGLFLDVPAESGEILLISNTEAACIRYYKLLLVPPSTDDPPTGTTSSSGSFRHRVPHDVHQYLATDLATRISSHRKGFPEVYRYLDYKNDTDHQYAGPIPHVYLYHNHSANKRSFEKQPIPTVDPEVPEERVWSIVAKNASFDDVSGNLGEAADGSLMEEKSEYWGIWLLPSFINHSCAPNCNRLRVGDAIVIRAASNISAGDELFLPYFDIFQPLPLRQENARAWDFRCACRRCELERSLGEEFRSIERQIIHLNHLLSTKWLNKPANQLHTDDGGLLIAMRDQLHDIKDAIEKFCRKKRQKREEVSTYMRRLKLTWDDVLKSPPHKYSKFLKLLRKHNLKKGPNISDHAYMEEVRQKLGEDHEHTATEIKWLKGSFIDAYIARYAVACNATMLVRIQRLANRDSEVRALWGEFGAVKAIVDIIQDVHPGNMLGQEFCSLLVVTIVHLRNMTDDDTTKLEELSTATFSLFSRVYYQPQSPSLTQKVLLRMLLRG